MTDEDVLREGVVEQAPTGTNHSAPFPGHVIDDPNARRKIVVILVVQLADVSQSRFDGRVESIEQVAPLTGDAEVIPPHAIVDCQPRCPAEAVLDIEAVVVFYRMTPRTALSDLPSA